MNPRVRVIRFARVTELAVLAAGEITAHVWLDASTNVVGQILRSGSGWHYQFADGSAAGLASSHSRQDLERQIVLYHLGSLPATADREQPAKDWFAAAS